MRALADPSKKAHSAFLCPLIAGVCATATLTGGATAHGQEEVHRDSVQRPSIVLVYLAAAQGCPGEESFRDGVRSRLGFDPFGTHGPGMAIQIALEGDELRGRLAIQPAEGAPARIRELRAVPGECDDLVQALAMATAVLLEPPSPEAVLPAVEEPSQSEAQAQSEPLQASDGERPWASPEPGEDAPAEESPTRTVAVQPTAGLWLALSRTPGLSIGPSVGLGLRIGRFQLLARVQGDFLVLDSLERDAHHLDVFVASGTLAPCLSFSEQLYVCAAATAGAMHARAEGGRLEKTAVAYLGGQLGLNVQLGPLLARLSLSIELSLVRTTILVEDQQQWTAPPLCGQLGFEMGYNFF